MVAGATVVVEAGVTATRTMGMVAVTTAMAAREATDGKYVLPFLALWTLVITIGAPWPRGRLDT